MKVRLVKHWAGLRPGAIYAGPYSQKLLDDELATALDQPAAKQPAAKQPAAKQPAAKQRTARKRAAKR